MLPLLALCHGLLALGPGGLAGQVLRVGASQAYATIDAAIAAATDGDLILVDPGNYPSFTIDGRSLSVCAAAGSFALTAGAVAQVRVRNVPVSGSVTVSGVATTIPTGAAPAVEIQRCAGTVRLIRSVFDPSADLALVPMRAVVDIVDSNSVWLGEVDVLPAAPRQGTTSNPVVAPGGTDAGICAVRAERSTVLLQDVRLRGYDNLGSPSVGRHAGDALRLVGQGTAVIVHANAANLLRGGAGGQFGGNAIHGLGLNTQVPDAQVCGLTNLVPGTGPLRGGYFALDHDRGLMQSGPIQIERFVVACLDSAVGAVTTASTWRPGTTQSLAVGALLEPRAFVLFVGPTRVRPFRVPGVANEALLDYLGSATLVVHAGVLPAAPVLLPVPNDAALVGVQAGAQAVLGPPSGTPAPPLTFSRAAAFVVE